MLKDNKMNKRPSGGARARSNDFGLEAAARTGDLIGG